MKHIQAGVSTKQTKDRLPMLLCCMACVLLMVCACGRKGDPFLSKPLAPDKVRAATAVARPGEIIVQWQMPRKNTDDTNLLDLGGVRVYRSQSTFDEYCVSCPPQYDMIFDYEYRGPSGQRPEKGRTIYHDTSVKPGNVYTYRLRTYNVSGIAGPGTDPLVMHYDTAPRSPQSFEVERKDNLVVLTWQSVSELADGGSVDGAAGYRVYRRRDSEEYELPLNAEVLSATFFEDTPAEDDVVYYYTVRALRTHEQTAIESAASPEIRLEYYDRTPPEVPRFLTAIAQADGVLLKWMAKTEQGFAGYHVYRRSFGRGEFRRLNPELLTKNSWLDTTAVKRRRYEYAVTAVDDSLSANESAFSEVAFLRYIPN